MLDVIEKPLIDELTKYQGKWKNLHFSTCGKSGLGFTLYDSEFKAKLQLERDLSSPISEGFRGSSFITINDLEIVFKGHPLDSELIYSHTIQMPIGAG